MFSKPSSQSQSISDAQIINSQLQQGQTEQVLTQNQSGELLANQQEITTIEVVKLLESLEKAVRAARLSNNTTEEVLDYLKPAKRETCKEKPDKNLIAQNLMKVSESLEAINETTDTGRDLFQKGQEIFKMIAPWLGAAVNLLGL
jgi:Mg/Co/Ni transporter MgtE